MITRRINGSIGGDCTALYSVELDCQYSLNEFIEAVLIQYPNEWGCFQLCTGTPGTFHTKYAIGYKHGALTSKIPEEYINRPIKCTKASGGWTNMDYVVAFNEQ